MNINFQNIFSKYNLNILFLSIVLVVLTTPHIGTHIRPGIDPSYVFAINYFFANDIQIGKDILFVFGPLGFLLSPHPLGNNLLIATVVTILLKFNFIFAVIKLYTLVKSIMTWKHWLLATFMAYALTSIAAVHSMLIFLPLLLILVYFFNNNFLWIIFASFIVTISVLVKSTSGIVSILFLISFSIYLIFNKEYKVLLVSIVTSILSFLIIWFSLYQNFYGIGDYFYGLLELSKGNSSAMTVSPNNNWILFCLFLLSFFAFPVFKKEKVVYLLYAISLLSTAAFFKYAISREDHIFNFEVYLLEFLIIAFIVTKNNKFKDLFFLIGTYLLFLSFIYATPFRDGIKPWLSKHVTSMKINSFYDTIKVNNRYQALRKKSISSVQQAKLDKESRKLIDNNNVDTYPWETSYIYANNLNWHPRPVFQSYVTYTKFLDEKNAAFYRSNKAPKFIIWQLNHGLGEVGSIDGRYLFNDGPLTVYEILNNYSVVLDKQAYLILKRDKPKLNTKILFEKVYKWNEWIPVPIETKNDSLSFLLAKTNIKRTLVQKIKKLIYKEFAVHIDYKLFNGKIVRHRLVVDTAQNGIWVNPLLHSLFDFDLADDVESIKLTHDEYDFFEESFKIRWNMVSFEKTFALDATDTYMSPINMQLQSVDKKDDNIQFSIDQFINGRKSVLVSGWAFFKNKTIDETIKYIAFKSNSKTYVFPTNKVNRKDLSSVFQAKKLDAAGFSLTINKDKLLPGLYDVYILLKEPDRLTYSNKTNKQIVIKK